MSLPERIAATLFYCALAIQLAACGGTDDGGASTETTAPPSTSDPVNPPVEPSDPVDSVPTNEPTTPPSDMPSANSPPVPII